MSDLTKFSDGASILQQVDVSDIFKNLAMGIAEAQQKLDDNSIAQAIKLAETQINGVSLLELGFAPVFYAFQYADISASINLQMALKEELEFGFGLDIELATKKGYSKDNQEFLSEDSYSETTEEYKTSRQMSFRAKEKKAVKINNTFVNQKEELDAKSRVERFKHDIKQQAAVEQVYDEIHSRKLSNNQSSGVDVWMEGGYLRIEEGLHFGTTGVGVFKIRDYGANTNVVLSSQGNNFSTGSNITDTLTDAKDSSTGTVYGLTKTGELYQFLSPGNWIPISSKLYFGYNSDEIRYGKNLKDGPNDSGNLEHTYPAASADNQNHGKHTLIHRALRLIQSNDPDVSITITGMSDPKGGTNPKNQTLAKRRAEKLRDHIFGSTAPISVKTTGTTNATGNSDLLKRYATIELDSDYLIFIGGAVDKDATPAKSSGSSNKFVYADDYDSNANYFRKINVMYGSEHLEATASTADEIINELNIQNHSSEKTSEELHYLLDDEAIVKLSLYTNQSDEIDIEQNEESSSEGTEDFDSFLTSKTKNEKSILNDSVTKNSKDNSFAFGASVDFRMSRQFEMSMEGNAAMAARLVSVPAPQAFVLFLQNTYIPTTTEE